MARRYCSMATEAAERVSYILDALRKSERQRRLGQPPDLTAGSDPEQPRTARGPRRWPWLAGTGLLLMLGAAAGVYWFASLDSADPDQRAQVAGPAEPAPADVTPAVAGPGPEDGDAGAAEAAEEPEEPAEPEVGERRRRTVIDRRSPSQRPATSVSRPAPARPGEVTTPLPVVPEGERERLVTDPQQAQQLIEAQSEARAAVESTAPAVEEGGDGEPPEEAEADWAPERADYLDIWELPLEVRRELPELNLSIHVFSVEVSERFVLINGERRLEGESLGEGARLAEISRQGAVIDFRDYRFLLKP